MKATFVAVVILFSATAGAQNWSYFHPETVRETTCSVTTTILSENGSGASREVYSAIGGAHREGVNEDGRPIGDFSVPLGYFPVDNKGRDSALDACKHWMRQASKRIKLSKGAK